MKASIILRSIFFSMVLAVAVSLVSVNNASAQTTLPETKDASIHGATAPKSISQVASNIEHSPLIIPITKEANNAAASGTVVTPEETVQVRTIAPTANYIQFVPTTTQSEAHQIKHVTVQGMHNAGRIILVKGQSSGSGAE